MINMKLTPEEAKTEGGAVEAEHPEYPYGLRIDLDDKALAKLGVTGLPEVGTRMTLHALVNVASASQYENQEGKDLSVSLQITDMELTQAASTDPKTLYPNSGMN